MKFLYIANMRLPTEKAHGIQIMKMCEALAENGVDVELVVPRRRNSIIADAFSYYSVKPVFKVTYLPGIDFITWGPFGFLVSTLRFLCRARRYAKMVPGARVYTREPLAPFFFPQATLELHTRSSACVARHAARRAARVVAITHGLKQALIEDGIPAERITVLPDGVDTEMFDISVSRVDARTRTSLPYNACVALYAGSFSLYPWKGLDVFIAAAVYAPDVLFVCVGGTKEEAERAAGTLPQNVRCVGKVSYAEIPYYLKAADVLILPNKMGDPMSERYTSPLKLFEYMASGTPIVASDLPSIREVVSPEEARFSTPGDAAILAQAVREVSTDDANAQSRARRAHDKAREYGWAQRAAHICALLS